MAGFKTHVTVGAATGAVVATFCYIVEWTANIYFAILLFFITFAGSFLPDVDSDSGDPIKIIFTGYGLTAAAISFYYIFDHYTLILPAIAISILIFLLVRFVLSHVFKRVTDHRGVIHSLPAFLIVFFGGLLLAGFFKRPDLLEKFSIAVAVSIGYLSHLVLDEIFAFNFMSESKKMSKKQGAPNRFFLKRLKQLFGVKKSFGTALDLGLREGKVTLVLYIILLVLAYLSYPTLRTIYHTLF